MTDTELLQKWREEEENFNLQGWDFSAIDGRWDCPAPPWDYKKIVQAYLKDEDLLLDMGTGGGEVLLAIGHPPRNTCVTEAYVPNLTLCREKLSPLGITVAQTFEYDKLPFPDERFDVIINRHESFDLLEVSRTLKPGGYFITQQVGNRNFSELEIALNDAGDTHSPDHAIEKYADALKGLGFRVFLMDEAFLPAAFFDVGAVIFYAKACPWNIPGFTAESHFKKLRGVYREIEETGRFPVTGHRFILAAKKP